MSDLTAAIFAEADPAAIDALPEAAIDALRCRLGLPAEHAEAPPVEPEAMMTCSEVAQRVGVHVETIRRAVRSEALRASHVGNSWRIAPADLDAWLSSHGRIPCAPQPSAQQPRPGRSGAVSRPLAHALANLSNS